MWSYTQAENNLKMNPQKDGRNKHLYTKQRPVFFGFFGALWFFGWIFFVGLHVIFHRPNLIPLMVGGYRRHLTNLLNRLYNCLVVSHVLYFHPAKLGEDSQFWLAHVLVWKLNHQLGWHGFFSFGTLNVLVQRSSPGTTYSCSRWVFADILKLASEEEPILRYGKYPKTNS